MSKATVKGRFWRFRGPLHFFAILFFFFGLYATVKVLYWGLPLPRVFEPAGPHAWRAADGREIRAADLDGDGVYDRFGAGNPGFRRPGSGAADARRLVVCLDGVPHAVMRSLWDDGHFRLFFPPVEAVSTFPSESETALTAMLQAPPAPGYENTYYDRAEQRIVGGVFVTLAQSAPYLMKLDYDQNGLFKGAHFVLPRKTYRADLGRLRKRFLASRSRVFVAHISTTDGLYHVLSPGEMRVLLLEFEDMVRDLFLESEGKLRVLLFSDHSNNLAPSRPAPIKRELREAGFLLGSSADGPRAVAIPEFGLVSFAAVYARPETLPALARVLAKAEGVELVVYREDTRSGAPLAATADATPSDAVVRVRLLSAAGSATVEARSDGSAFRYAADGGDPLELLPVWNRLKAAGKVDAAGFALEADLFAATLHERYPDAPFRLWQWARQDRNYVRNPAELMVSLKDGYYAGKGVFERIVTLASTHGGLGRDSSLGFAMSTDAPLPRALRYDEVLADVKPD